MFTDPGHLRAEDPGKVEGNTVFTYLDIFDPDKQRVADLKAQYQRGGLGDVKVKRHLNDIMQALLTPIREKREQCAKDPGTVMQILKDGTAKARQVAATTMAQVRQVMKIDY
jgi:tryptophanyl-tRNA synthetase